MVVHDIEMQHVVVRWKDENKFQQITNINSRPSKGWYYIQFCVTEKEILNLILNVVQFNNVYF